RTSGGHNMTRLCGCLLAAGALLVAAPDGKEGAAKDELKKLEGSWTIVSSEVDGVKSDPADLKGTAVAFKGDKMGTLYKGRALSEPRVKVARTWGPKALDQTPADGPMKGQSVPAIYELDGDTLKICWDFSEKRQRPKEFTAMKGSPCVLMVYKREKQ